MRRTKEANRKYMQEYRNQTQETGKWECVCSKTHPGIESWSTCYSSHLRDDNGMVHALRGAGVTDSQVGLLWDHSEGIRRNYPASDQDFWVGLVTL
jgi:hypothetical protein